MSDGYVLTRREHRGALFGLTAAHVVLLAAALVSMTALPRLLGPPWGFTAGLVAAAGCGWLALWPVAGRPAHAMVPVVARFAAIQATGRSRWTAPLPLLSGSPPPARPHSPQTDRAQRRPPPATPTAPAPTAPTARTAATAPPCLAGLDLHAAPRPTWAGADGTLAPVGLVRDRRTGTVTVVLDVRGGPFSLLDTPAQHARLADWGRVLAQFARETSPVTRLGWSLWSAPTTPTEHLDRIQATADPSSAEVSEDDRVTARVLDTYRELLTDAAVVQRHELRLWITTDPSRLPNRRDAVTDAPTAAQTAALASAQALADRCRAAGLLVAGVLSPIQIAEAIRVRADPATAPTLTRVRKGLAELAGLTPPGNATPDRVHALPMAVERRWDAVRIDDAWHRVFWVAQWPTTVHDPRWLEPLLLAPAGVRALSVSYEPIALRASRRRLTADAVSVESQLQARERHGLRAGVELRRAQADIDTRESELVAGHTEYGYLALICVTGTDSADLDARCHAVLDQAAQSGLTELRPLHGRHDTAWACTLPLGRTPDRELLRTTP